MKLGTITAIRGSPFSTVEIYRRQEPSPAACLYACASYERWVDPPGKGSGRVFEGQIAHVGRVRFLETVHKGNRVLGRRFGPEYQYAGRFGKRHFISGGDIGPEAHQTPDWQKMPLAVRA